MCKEEVAGVILPMVLASDPSEALFPEIESQAMCAMLFIQSYTHWNKQNADQWNTDQPTCIAQSIAGNKGGKCLSTHYINSVTKLRFQCENGHRWLASPYNVYKGSWCRTCSYRIIASKLKHDGSELKKIARKTE